MRMKKFVEEPDFLGLGLSRPWEGALLGILSALFVIILGWNIGFFYFFAIGLLYPSILVFLLIEPLTNALPPFLAGPLQFVAFFLGFGLSMIIPAISGSLIISKGIMRRTSGIMLMVIYLVLCIYFSIFLPILRDY